MVQHAAFSEHLATLRTCRVCANVFGEPVTGAVWGARVMLVGQAPGPHEVEDRRPFAYTAGKRLFSWFPVGEETFRHRIHMCAVIRCFPGKDPKSGGDRVPADEEIANCGAHLDREIRLLEPELLIAVGTLAAQQLVGASALRDVVGRKHRVTRAGKAFDVVVLPHPSGRSTWLNQPENAVLLQKSLRLIHGHRAWKATFAEGRSPGDSRRTANGKRRTANGKRRT